MVRSSLSTLILVAVLSACASEPGPGPAFDEASLTQEVMETLAEVTEAMNAHDPDRLFSHYRQAPSFFYLGCTEILYGWDTFSSRVRPYYRRNTDVTFQQEVLSVQILAPTVAVAAMQGSSTRAPALFWTEVLQKGEDGRWLITYEHESWPGCPVPRGPHPGTEEMDMTSPPDSGQGAGGGSSPGG
jgi:ketosteroid isomerase-like protein